MWFLSRQLLGWSREKRSAQTGGLWELRFYVLRVKNEKKGTIKYFPLAPLKLGQTHIAWRVTSNLRCKQLMEKTENTWDSWTGLCWTTVIFSNIQAVWYKIFTFLLKKFNVMYKRIEKMRNFSWNEAGK